MLSLRQDRNKNVFMKKSFWIVLALGFLAGFIFSSSLNVSFRFERPESPAPERIRFNFVSRKVIVSWYSNDGCLGCRKDRIMRCGGVFDENAYTAASPVENGRMLIPCGTKVKLMHNGRSVEAVIADSGGFKKYNRDFDVSKAVFRELAPLDAGLLHAEAAW